jgi:hypothetical protein
MATMKQFFGQGATSATATRGVEGTLGNRACKNRSSPLATGRRLDVLSVVVSLKSRGGAVHDVLLTSCPASVQLLSRYRPGTVQFGL